MKAIHAAGLLVATLALAGCNAMQGGLKDGSGNEIRIGREHHNASTGPGKSGWPEPENTQRAH